jgi:2-methylcitrate dehydratase PrpD
MGATSDLIRFIAGTGYDDIPPEAVEKTKLQILDCLGVTVAAAKLPITEIVVSELMERGGPAEASVIGHALRVPCSKAAWANGTTGHALDFDDNSIDLPRAIHQTVTSLPAALSVGELVHADGRALIRAVALGIEGASKVDRAVHGCGQAYHGTGVFGVLSSAIGAAILLGLDADQLEHALGMACSMAAGLQANFGTMTKPLHAGEASRNGVMSALLARKGFTSARAILERKYGFAEVIGRGLDHDYLRNHLGNPWEVLEPGIHLKAYPACMVTHPGLDAIIALAHAQDVDGDQVATVEVTARRDLRETLVYDEPKTGFEGKFSMQFCAAVGLLARRATLEEFTDETARDPRVVGLERKVKLSVDPHLPGTGLLATRVRVAMRDGRRYEEFVEYPRGSKKNPMTMDEVAEKFRACAAAGLSPGRCEEVVKHVLHLEALGDVTDLTRALSAG